MAAIAASVDRRPGPAPDAGAALSPEQRVIDASLRCVARWGLTKTTLDDIARESGYSRATIYRLFPGGKDPLVAAVVAAELDRFEGELAAATAAATTLEDVLVAGVGCGARFLAGHEALQFLVAHEPEVILPHVSFAGMRHVLAHAARLAAPVLAPHVGADEAPRVAEWLTRIVFSYTAAPAEGIDLADEACTRALVRDFVLPGLVHHLDPAQGG